MFGYVTVNARALSEKQYKRYRSAYCGLCHALKQKYGSFGRMTLSYDVTFLYLLLSSLYEPDETVSSGRCLPHPIKVHDYVQSCISDYCCDMNIALAYHKGLDDWRDDHSLVGLGEAKLFEKAYKDIEKKYPEKCREVENCLTRLTELENNGTLTADTGANLTARMLGVIYQYKTDLWSQELTRIGEGLGRFIYLMDAYDDLKSDIRRKRFNPLVKASSRPDFETIVKESLTMLIAESTEAFETLPLVKDIDILRNILYSGCWLRYEQKQMQRSRKSGVSTPEKEEPSASDSAVRHKEDGA